ncbi:hypothetical protein KUCAC02_029947, partial [Chaenocephalus aceratus]
TDSDDEQYNELRRKDSEESLKTSRSKAKKLTKALLKKRILNILLKRPPSEWQEALRTTDLREPARVQGSERGLDSSAGGVLPPPHTDTLVTDGNVDGDSSQSEAKLELFLSEPHQILDLVTEFTDQVLSLTRISNWVDEPLKELMQDIETNSRKMEEDGEKLTLQLDEMQDRIASDQERAATLKRKVQLHDLLKTEDHDTVSDALGVKISEVHRCCVDSRLTYLSTLEKLSSVEYRISLLFQFMESIPKESLETLRLIKDSDRSSRLREEQVKLEREKHLEMLKKCKQRSMDESKKKTGRKLRPRCFPVEQKITVSEEDNIPAEEELHAFLFTTEDE